MSAPGPPPEQERNVAQFRAVVALADREGPAATVERFDEFFDPDYEWQPAVSQFGGRTYRGRDGYAQWIADLAEIATTSIGEFTEIRPLPDGRVLGLGRLRMVGTQSGVELDSEYAILVEMRDGLATRGRAFLSHAEAEEAADA